MRSSTTDTARAFETMADTIMYRWSAERDVWVSNEELAQARSYLARLGVTTADVPEAKVAGDGDIASTALAAARVVLLGLRHLHAQRRSRPRA